MTKDTKSTIKKLLLSAGVLIGVIGIVFLIMHLTGLDQLTREELQEFIKSKKALGPLIYIAISFLQVTFVPIPGAVTILAGNYVFGPWGAFIYSYIGMLLGGMFAYLLGKIIGRPFANWLAGGKEKVDEWLLKLRGRENVLLFFMFFFPFFPDDILCTVAGLLPISALGFLCMQLITRATSVLGTLFFMSGEIIPWNTWWGITTLILVSVFCIIAFFIAFINAEKINNFALSIFRKVYYGEKDFKVKKKGFKKGIQTVIDQKVILDDKKWRVASFYKTKQGFVVDIYSSGIRKSSPQPVNFNATLNIDGVEKACEYKYQISYYPRKSNKNKEDKKIAIAYMKHYKRDRKYSRKFVRLCFPYVEETMPKTLELNFKTPKNSTAVVNLIRQKKQGVKDVIELVKGD